MGIVVADIIFHKSEMEFNDAQNPYNPKDEFLVLSPRNESRRHKAKRRLETLDLQNSFKILEI